jgi:hypothetical protein
MLYFVPFNTDSKSEVFICSLDEIIAFCLSRLTSTDETPLTEESRWVTFATHPLQVMPLIEYV